MYPIHSDDGERSLLLPFALKRAETEMLLGRKARFLLIQDAE
jgi:hypothetical protein